MAAVLEEDNEELEHLDEDHERRVQQRVINDEVVDVVGGSEDATAKETTSGSDAA